MTKQKYYDLVQKQFDDVTAKICGWHELANVLQTVSDYTTICIHMTEDIYNDKDISYSDYIELNETISNCLKEVCRIVKRGN